MSFSILELSVSVMWTPLITLYRVRTASLFENSYAQGYMTEDTFLFPFIFFILKSISFNTGFLLFFLKIVWRSYFELKE